ncbi:MAG TPA: F0F1 ATP synthase subunit B [Luteibaculaceae bacterium]|nr:F0F1 ATP synthase subunit B [Luteibaculaceae bacterium]
MNPLVKPELGLIVWTTIVFVLLLILLAKFAWKPILSAVKDREQSIKNALDSANAARDEMAKLTATNEQLLKEAYAEKDAILKKAKESAEAIVAQAKGTAKDEADKLINNARAAINIEKQAALTELKNQVAALSIEIAEKIVRENLSSNEKQQALANTLVKEVSLN